MDSQSTTLSRRGWSLLGAAIGLVVAGRLLGTVELSTLGVGTSALIAGATLWTRSRSLPLGVRRVIRPDQVHVGGEARVDLELHARGATPQATFTDVFDDGRRAARFLAPALDAGQRARAAYRIPTDRRGRFGIGPMLIGVSDPFGLSIRSFAIGGSEDVIVRPRVHDLRAAASAPGRRRARLRHRSVLPVPSPVHDEFLALRDYEVGDDLRRVHWRSSARTGELRVREDESAWQPHATVVLDNRAWTYPGDAYEHAIEAVASIALRLRRSGQACDVFTMSGRSLSKGSTRSDRLLDELAVLEPDRRDAGMPRALAPRDRQGLIVVVSSSRDRATVASYTGPGSSVVMVACDGNQSVPSRRARVVDGHPAALAASWNAVMTPRRDTRRRGVSA